jgi:hypothetical protein
MAVIVPRMGLQEQSCGFEQIENAVVFGDPLLQA